MSHHLDTPLAAQNGQLFIDDLYVFSGDASTVFIMDVNSNITGVHVKPGFHHEARYEFKVHFDGADFETLTYRVSFGEAGPDGRQTMKLHALTGRDAREDAATGQLVLEGRTGQTASAGGTRLWAGRIANSFYVDLSLLAKVNGAVKDGLCGRPLGVAPGEREEQLRRDDRRIDRARDPAPGIPSLSPAPALACGAPPSSPQTPGGWRQINRGGYPMMWPIFWPDDGQFTNPANTRHPSKDFDAEGEHIAEHIAAVVAASGTSDDPMGYGRTVARELFPDVLPYVIGTPATFGFAIRNGRTLADNAPEVMMSLVAGAAVPSGLKPSVAKDQRASKFPYVVPA